MNPKGPLIIYHSADLDGKCSAAIALTAMQSGLPAELYPLDYGQPFDWSRVEGCDRRVFMLDFSLQPFGDMLKLNALLTKDLFTWIDHHESALESFKKLANPALWDARVEIGKAGCELCWEYFRAGEEMPRGVELLGRYDVWDLTDSHTLPFQYGMREKPNDPELPIWESIFLNDLKFLADTLDSGHTILRYERRQNAIYASARGFGVEFEGHLALACNRGLVSSQFFDAVWDPHHYDLMLGFCLQPDGNWKVQLFSDREDVDVSVIAAKYGGGGHKGAAGFLCKTLPFAQGGTRVSPVKPKAT